MTKCPCGLGELGLSKVRFHTSKKGISRMQLSHTHPVAGAVFDDPNLVSAAGLVPVVALAQRCRLGALADGHLSVPSDKGANAGGKVMSLVAGMVAGADSIDLCRPRDYADIRRHVFPEALVGLGFRCGHKGRWSA